MNDAKAFGKFEQTGRGQVANQVPKVSLRESGLIGLNKTAFDVYFEHKDAAVLCYDKQGK